MRSPSNGSAAMAMALLLSATVPSAAVAGPATEKEASRLLKTGQYAKAEAAYKKLARTKRGVAAVGLARVLLETGRYGEAIKRARQGARGKLWSVAKTLVGEAERLLGRPAQAEATLKGVLKRRPNHYRALIQLGLAHLDQGEAADAKSIFDRFYDDYGADKIDKSSAEQLTYVAIACRLTDNYRDAYDTMMDATKQDATHVEAWIQLAEMSMEKYEVGYAEQHYKSVLKINPHHARALLGLAEVKLEQSNDVKAALKLLDKAEKTAPRSMGTAVLRAQILIDAEQYAKAEALLAKALKRDPNHLGALSMLATSYFLRDNSGGFKRMQAKVLKRNPRYTRFFRTVVKLAVRHHRYQEAIVLSKQAIKIDPQDWYSLADLGTNFLRLGDDKQGLKHLREAWRGDRFNVRNYNLLNLFEDTVAKEYTFIRSRHFRLRVHKSEQALIKRTIVPLLEEAYALYVKKYSFTPKGPIIIELFQDPNHYAVRTVGLPGLGALGVCFGRVITSISPTQGRFNWGQVLWHELNHVFTIQLSRSRVPRWLTEGLADMEPVLRRPEWKRENDFDIYKAIRSKRLRGLASMTTAFSRARNIQEMVVAYYQGSLMARYLIKHWGMKKMLRALRAYGKGRRTEQILPAMTGISLAELDRKFKAAELTRLAHYNRNWFVDHHRFDDLSAFKAKASAAPNDPAAQAALAVALLTAGKFEEARKQAEKVLKGRPKNRQALYVVARAAQVKRDRARAEGAFRKLLAAGGDGYDVRLALGRLALARRDIKEGRKHLDRAKRLDPEKGMPYVMLAKAYEKRGKPARVIAELKGLARLDQQSFPLVAKLVDLLAKRKAYADLRRFGKMAYYINPASVKLHTHLAEAYAAPAPRPKLKKAVWHLETALLANPRRPAEIHVKLARIHLQRNDRRRAKAELNKALKAKPGHAGAKELLKKVK